MHDYIISEGVETAKQAHGPCPPRHIFYNNLLTKRTNQKFTSKKLIWVNSASSLVIPPDPHKRCTLCAPPKIIFKRMKTRF